MRPQAFGRQAFMRHWLQMVVDPVRRHAAGVKAFERSHGLNEKKPLEGGFLGQRRRNCNAQAALAPSFSLMRADLPLRSRR